MVSLLSCAFSVPIIAFHNTLNEVVRNIFVTYIILNSIQVLIDTGLGGSLLIQCDFEYIIAGSHLLIFKGFQIFSIWSLLTFSTLTYEVSRIRYYFAKHAFRIHKLSTLRISAQVIIEASVLSSFYMLIFSYFSSLSMFSNFPSLHHINQVSNI